ncbi:MAG: hypothetical protein ABIJ47_07825 [Candidatus Bathyarchaeota archaeon]
MVDPGFGEVEGRIVEALEEAYLVLGGVGVEVVEVTAEEFYDYLTGETFTGDKTTLSDILGSLYYVVHEVVEIGELKEAGVRIDRGTVVGAPRELIYAAHFRALDAELGVALRRGDLEWVRVRVGNHYGHLTGDEFMPECMRGEAEALYERYREYHVG